MPDAPTPTYREEQGGDRRRYQCLVPDARYADGHCDYWGWDEDLMVLHLQQQHAGIIMKAPDATAAEAEAADDRDDDTAVETPGPATAAPHTPAPSTPDASPSHEPDDVPEPPTPPPAPGGSTR